MSYLDAVLKEGLRMYPSVPSIGRTLTEDVEINGYKLLSGTDLTLHIYSIHHDPDIYNEPYKFNPDRWVNNEVPFEEYPFCYIPFSGECRSNELKFSSVKSFQYNSLAVVAIAKTSKIPPYRFLLKVKTDRASRQQYTWGWIWFQITYMSTELLKNS